MKKIITRQYIKQIIMEQIASSDPKAAFDAIYRFIKKDENYVPRTHKTIGGGWTRDTWQKGNVKAFLEDEGYTQGIIAPGIVVYYNPLNKLVFREGSPEDLINLFNELNETK